MYIKATDDHVNEDTKNYFIRMMKGLIILKQLRDMYTSEESKTLKKMIVDISVKIREEYPEINEEYPLE